MDGGDNAAAAAVAVAAVEGDPPQLLASIRMYVGGLGACVTAVDMENTFSSLGRVSRVEFVQRSDSRRFAFMDFKPHSEKSLAKLLSTYNGCMWKGGKLKLEKAKEHYIDRLKREWAEDAEVKSGDYLNPSGNKDYNSPEEPKLKPEEKNHINIFFPKLKKMKALPFKGTGRHKYSFQRVDVPPLPINFCDCEEHCRSHDVIVKEQPFSDTDTDRVIGDEELNVMNSVMAKLFGRQTDNSVLDVATSKSTNFIHDIPSTAVDEAENVNETKMEVIEAEDSEEDNFVMNIGSKKSQNMMDLLQAKEWGRKLIAQDGQKKSSYQQHQEKKTRTRQEVEDDSTTMKSIPDGERLNSALDGHEKWFPDLGSGVEVNSEMPAEHLEKGFSQQLPSVALENKENPAINNSGKGSLWVQKSSWRDLVGDTSSSLFSLSHILPSDRAVKKKLQKTCDEADGCFPKKAPKPSNVSDDGQKQSSSQQPLEKKSRKRQRIEGENATVKSPLDEEKVNVERPVDHMEGISQQQASEALESEDHVTKYSGKGSTWVQKSSWRDLVGDPSSSSFSVSNILPSNRAAKLKRQKTREEAATCFTEKVSKSNTGSDAAFSISAVQQITSQEKPTATSHQEAPGEASTATGNAGMTSAAKENSPASNHEEVLQRANTGNEKDAETSGTVVPCSQKPKISSTPVKIGEVCTFMRTAESEKQWTKAKTALSSYFKKKSNADSSPNNGRDGSRLRN